MLLIIKGFKTMSDFLESSELWFNVIGGVIAGVVLALLVWLWNWNKRRHIKDLIKLEGKSIKHRNIAKLQEYDNIDKWARKAKIIHDEIVITAKKISPAAGALIDWLGLIDEYIDGDELSYWISALDKVNERIRTILEHHI